MLFLLSLPVLFETKFLLTIWLGIVPDNTILFLRIMICTSLIYTIANPLMIANQATGKVKKYQTICGIILLMIIPLSYCLLKLGFPAYSVFIVHFCMESLAQLARMIILKPLIGIGLRDYFSNIYLKVSIVVVTSLILPGFVYFSMSDTVVRFMLVCLTCVLSVSVVVYTLGLSVNERVFVKDKMVCLLSKFRSNHK